MSIDKGLFYDNINEKNERWLAVYHERIVLTSKDIVEKEFKIDTRGYRPQEVDKFLDVIIRNRRICFDHKRIRIWKKELIEDNIKLKQEIAI